MGFPVLLQGVVLGGLVRTPFRANACAQACNPLRQAQGRLSTPLLLCFAPQRLRSGGQFWCHLGLQKPKLLGPLGSTTEMTTWVTPSGRWTTLPARNDQDHSRAQDGNVAVRFFQSRDGGVVGVGDGVQSLSGADFVPYWLPIAGDT